MNTTLSKQRTQENTSIPRRRQQIRRGLLIISALSFPFTIFMFSPMLSIHGASEGVVNASVLVFVALFVSSLFLGRAFCGWLCPCGALQDWGCQVNNTPLTRRHWIKFVVWVPWVIVLGILLLRNHAFRHIDFFFPVHGGLFLHDTQSYRVYYMVIALFVVLSFALGRRPFCHYLCWMAPFMIIGRTLRNIVRFPSLQIVADRGRCDENCRICTEQCPMSLDVDSMVRSEQMEHPECILCGHCVDGCPENALQYTFSGKRNKRQE